MKGKWAAEDPGYADPLDFPRRLAVAKTVIALNTPAFAHDIFDKVLVQHLRVPPRGSANGWGSAEYFIQRADRTIPWNPEAVGFDFAMSGVSKTGKRADESFWDALIQVAEICQEVLVVNLFEGIKAELYVRLMLDKPVPYVDRPEVPYLPRYRSEPTTLLEVGPFHVSGKAKPTTITITRRMLLVAELGAYIAPHVADLLLGYIENDI